MSPPPPTEGAGRDGEEGEEEEEVEEDDDNVAEDDNKDGVLESGGFALPFLVVGGGGSFTPREQRGYADWSVPSVVEEVMARGRWLLGLLVVQSSSSIILQRYEALIQDHVVVTFFLTMLVGAGGNAGNQSAIEVIRGMATREIGSGLPALGPVLAKQVGVGALLAILLSGAGYLRVSLSGGTPADCAAISTALFCIVFTSVVLGTLLPFTFRSLGVDPANAGTTIQVTMDVLGVLFTCLVATSVLGQLAPPIIP